MSDDELLEDDFDERLFQALLDKSGRDGVLRLPPDEFRWFVTRLLRKEEFQRWERGSNPWFPMSIMTQNGWARIEVEI